MEGNYNNNGNNNDNYNDSNSPNDYNNGYNSDNNDGYGSSQNEIYNPYHTYQRYSQNDEEVIGEKTIEQQTAGQQDAYQQPTGQQTAGQQNAYQQPTGQQTANQQTAGQQSTNQQTANQQTAGQQSAYQQTAGQRSVYQQTPYQQAAYQQNMYQQNTPATPKKKGAFAGFGATLVKVVTIALVFGLVSAVAFGAVNQIRDISFGIFENEREDTDKEDTSKKDTDITADEEVKNPLPQTDTDINFSAVMDVSDIVENVMPCVVAISNTGQITYQSIWGQTFTEESESAGTGFLVKQDNQYIYIATNNHVVADATKLEVQFCDGAIVEAEIKGTVASKDLAVIKVAVEMIPAETMQKIRIATLGDANEIEVGEAAIAIGNALGYGQSVTTGVISAKGRSVTVQDPSTGSYVVNNNLLQTDAAINPGNSGGALLNIDGEVIGINSVKYADTDVEGIGYAIPINDAMLIIDKLIEGERIDESQSGYLGIQGQDSNLGAYVLSVFEGSAAERAGIKAGDIIIEFEGYDIATMSQLKELLSYYPAGANVKFVILRSTGDEEYSQIEITVTLGDSSIIPQ